MCARNWRWRNLDGFYIRYIVFLGFYWPGAPLEDWKNFHGGYVWKCRKQVWGYDPQKILELNRQLEVAEKNAPRCYMAESVRGMGSRWQDVRKSLLK